MDRETKSLLLSTPLFRDLSPETLETLLSHGARIRRFSRGETLMRAGETLQDVAVVLSGAVRLEREDPMGNRELVGMAAAGELFAEVFAVLGDLPAPVTAVAAEPIRVLFLPAARLLETPETAQRLLRLIAGKNYALTEKLRHISRRTTREKLLSFLDAERSRAGSARFTIAFDRQQLADYLAVDRSAMCRALSALRSEGVLDYDRRRFFFPHGGKG